MVLKNIPSTDIQMSALGLGTVKFGRNQQVKYPKPFDLPSDAAILELLELAQELGINYLDTAPAYGTSEKRIGKLLVGQRENWVIGTKAGEFFENGKSRFDFSAKVIIASIENSLRDLKTDYLDLVFIHSDGNDVDLLKNTGALEALQALKIQQKIKAIGISSKTAEGGTLALEMGCDVVMLMYHPYYLEELPVIEKAAELNKSIFVKKALASGHLDLLEEKKPVEQTLEFIFEKAAVKSVVVGTINVEHLRENAAICSRVLLK